MFTELLVTYIYKISKTYPGKNSVMPFWYNICQCSHIDAPLSGFVCRQDHEYVAKGYIFRKGRMKIVVSKIYRVRY